MANPHGTSAGNDARRQDTDSGVAIESRGVTKAFSGRSALDDINLDIEPGSFVSIIGPSGSGKSTLLRLVAGLVEPDRGSIAVDGLTPNDARRRHLLSLVPQTPALLPWKTVDENVRLLVRLVNGRAAAGRELDRAVAAILDRVGLADEAGAKPRQLSGGMQQRVGLARAFLRPAPLLLMDEPFASLDEITRSEMRYLLLEMWTANSGTVLFVTHSLTEAVALSDRVVVLGYQPGRVVGVHNVTLERPRSAALEDDDRFYEQVRAVRSLLWDGSP